MWNIPNYLTTARIILIPVMVTIYCWPMEARYWLSSSFFVFACFTDWLDGYLARRWRQSTAFGAFLDPVADKLIVSCALILLAHAHATLWVAIPALIIVGREIVVSALREWMAEIGKRTHVSVSQVGKWKTGLQMFAIAILMATKPEPSMVNIVGYIALTSAAFLTIWSMMKYLKVAWPFIYDGV